MLAAATLVDAGSCIIDGKTPLGDETRRPVPPALYDEFTAIIGGHVRMAAVLVEFRQPPPQATAVIAPQVRLSPVGDYLMWRCPRNAAVSRSQTRRWPTCTGRRCPAVAGTAVRSWHRDRRALLAKAVADATFFTRVRR